MPFLEHRAEIAPDLGVGLGVAVGELRQVAEDAAGDAAPIAARIGLSWIISRDTLNGRSAESTMPRMKRSQRGSNSASSVMNTRLT